MRTQAVVFPFDLFGSGGTAAGAQLLGDALREVIDDTNAETKPVRQKAFVDGLTVTEVELDTIEAVTNWRTLGQRAAKQALKADFALWLSGNHLGCLPLLESLDDTLIVQFDAHLDCYDLHDTHETLSHGNFLRHLPKSSERVVHVGHRDLFLPEKAIREQFREVHSAEALAIDEAKVLAALRKRVTKAKSVWIDLDVDVIDPSVCPAVHSPSPFGLFGPQLFRLFEVIGFEKLRGVSLSEFDPGRDVRDQSLNLLGWLLEWLLLKKSGV